MMGAKQPLSPKRRRPPPGQDGIGFWMDSFTVNQQRLRTLIVEPRTGYVTLLPERPANSRRLSRCIGPNCCLPSVNDVQEAVRVRSIFAITTMGGCMCQARTGRHPPRARRARSGSLQIIRSCMWAYEGRRSVREMGRQGNCRPRRNWEFAARGGPLTAPNYAWGRRTDAGRPTHGQHLAGETFPYRNTLDDGYGNTLRPVGSFPANGYGPVRHGGQRPGSGTEPTGTRDPRQDRTSPCWHGRPTRRGRGSRDKLTIRHQPGIKDSTQG